MSVPKRLKGGAQFEAICFPPRVTRRAKKGQNVRRCPIFPPKSDEEHNFPAQSQVKSKNRLLHPQIVFSAYITSTPRKFCEFVCDTVCDTPLEGMLPRKNFENLHAVMTIF